MTIDKRTRGKLPSPGPYLAEITNHLDSSQMGGVEVALIKGIPNSVNLQADTYPVKYLSPFYGVTSIRFEGNDSSDFNDVQKSYGMWMVPPDVGTTVMVIFIDGDPNQGYWIGCVPDKFQNHMVPGIAASDRAFVTASQKQKYGTSYLPVAEFNKKTQLANHSNVDNHLKPVHPFADRLLAQGLLLDTVRGVTSSSARREVPGGVFGISTPGPLDLSPGAKRGKIGYKGNKQAPVSRLGGTTFVMDDGDIDGQNELVRIRTRTGHQILLHNSSDLIYIGNAKGSAWIELTSAGKIDVYAEDSISMHTKGDFNLRADRDFNLEAGRNFNIASSEGDVNINSQTKLNLIANSIGASTVGDLDITVGGASKHTSIGKLSIGSSAITAIKGGTDLSLSGGTSVTVSAGILNLNGPPATPPTAATKPVPLNLYSVSQNNGNASWSNGNLYKSGSLLTIMQRVPTHEPWSQHESTNPAAFSIDKTDSQIKPPETTANGVLIPSAPSANTPYPAKNGPASDRGTVKGEPFPWTTDEAFLTKVKEVATKLHFDPIDLLAIMNLESARTFDPAITNSLGYTGLIQFGKPAAASLKTTTDYLRGLTRVDQMDWVYKYFNNLWGWPNSKCTNPTLANLYLTVLLPAFRFYGPDERIADATNPKTAAYYNANPGFDPSPKKGYFTTAMVEAVVLKHKQEVLQCLANADVKLT